VIEGCRFSDGQTAALTESPAHGALPDGTFFNLPVRED
jgi:hypothetical protein